MARVGLALLAALPLLPILPGRAAAQFVRLDARSAELGAEYRGNWRMLAGEGSFNTADWQEWLRLPFAGELLSSRLFHYRLLLSPSLAQQTGTRFESPLHVRNLGVDFGATLLQASRIPMTMSAVQASGSWRGGMDGERDFIQSSLSGTMSLVNRWLPLQLGLSRRTTEATWLTSQGSPAIRQDQTVRGMRLSAQNTKLALSWHRQWFDDRAGMDDFWTENRAATHMLRWGKGSRLESSVESFRREGRDGYRNTSWSERLHIQHTQSATSDLFWDRRTVSGTTWTNRESGLGLTTRLRPAQWLEGSAAGLSHRSEFAGGSTARRSLTPSLGYTIALPFRASFSGNAFLGIEDLNREGVEEGIVEVVDERYTVSDLRSFTLGQRFVEPASVAIRSEDQTITYLRDRDYQLIEAGSLMQVRIPAGSRIQTGETLRVGYRYRLVGAQAERATATGYSVTLAVLGLTVQHAESRRDATVVDGAAAGYLSDTFDRMTQVGLVRQTPIGRIRLEASRRFRRGPGYDDRIDEVQGSHSASLGSFLQSFANVSGSRTSSGSVQIVAVFANAGFNAQFGARTRLFASLDRWSWAEAGRTTEITTLGTVSLDWQFGGVETVWRIEHQRRENSHLATENRASVRFVRRF